MDKTKAAVSDFLHKSGRNDTTVHENVAPAVTNETVHKRHHEDVTTAVDREVHQDHYHTAVQPVKDREVLPEQHAHRVVPVEHRETHHGHGADVKARLEQEAAQFRSTRSEGTTKETSSTSPTVAGEHVHHHVHETIQPVVQKETIQPSVVHTTVPVHETIHNDPKHHTASALPAISMSDFKKQGGALGGREERTDMFEGEPKAIGQPMDVGTKHSTHTGMHPTGSSHRGNDAVVSATPEPGSSTGMTGAGYGHKPTMKEKLDPRVDSDRDGSNNMGMAKNQPAGTTGTGSSGYPSTTTNTNTTTSSGIHPGTHGSAAGAGTTGQKLENRMDPRVDGSSRDVGGITQPSGLGSSTGATGPHTHGTSGAASGATGVAGPTHTTGSTHPVSDPAMTSGEKPKKASFFDKLNPMKDSDGDGKKGFMH